MLFISKAAGLQDIAIALKSSEYNSAMQKEQERLGTLRSTARELLRHASARYQIISALLRWREKLLNSGYRVRIVADLPLSIFLCF